MNVEETARTFSLNLSKTEAFNLLKEKRQQMRKDEETRNLIKKFEHKQEECQKKQERDDLTREDLQELRNIRSQLSQNNVFLEYQQAVSGFQQVCRQSVDKLSSLLGMDIASYIVNSGGCC